MKMRTASHSFQSDLAFQCLDDFGVEGIFYKIIWYCQWCSKNMLEDSKKILTKNYSKNAI